ncbi:hypothetical protein OAG36_00580 [bacterium]|nr:hypothetical protein [bacterium]
MKKAILGIWLLAIVVLSQQTQAQDEPTNTVPLIRAEKAVIFNGGEGVGYYLLIITDDETTLIIRCNELVGTDSPKVPDDPTKPKPPTTSKYLFKELSKTWYAQVTGTEKKLEAAKLSVVFLTMSAKIRSGAYGDKPTIAKIGPDVGAMNKKIITDEDRRKAWRKPFFDDGFGKELQRLIDTGKVSTKDEFADVFQEVYLGLTEVK